MRGDRDFQPRLLLFAGLVPPLAALLLIRNDVQTLLSIAVAACISFFAFRWTCYLIPLLAPMHVKAGLVGRDINKKGTDAGEKLVPESLGLAPGVMCLISLAIIHLCHSLKLVPRLCAALNLTSKTGSEEDPWMDDFPAALASISIMLMLGFVDDVLDLPWRVKLVMPIAASLPLLAAYSGGTIISIPKPIISSFDLPYTYVDVGILYYVYMAMLVIFCSNAINILAGVNGLEAGQTYLVGSAIITHNLLKLGRSQGVHTFTLLSPFHKRDFCALPYTSSQLQRATLLGQFICRLCFGMRTMIFQHMCAFAHCVLEETQKISV
jgi:UDP-N-acetylglucosamine--dolichyl-phosphate N-acetylglucosaminephosphotransferase